MAAVGSTMLLQHGRPCLPVLSRCLSSRRMAFSSTPSSRSHAVDRVARSSRAIASRPVAAAAAPTDANGTSSSFDYDLFCIGAGSGGVRAARMAASAYGAKVGICELPFNPIASDEAGGAGGTCVLRGCVPKKLFVYCSEYRELFKEAEGFGYSFPQAPTLDWPAFLAKKNAELLRLNGIYQNLLKNAGVDLIEGRGVVVDPHTVEVAGQRFTAKNILVATGARAFVPKFEGSELCMISDDILQLPQLPKSLAVIGGSYIGLEFAGIFARLGVEVHVVCRSAPLRGFDEQVRAFATEQFEVAGLKMHVNASPVALRQAGEGTLAFTVSTKEGESSVESTFHVEQVLAATGRKPNVAGLGLEAAGVEMSGKGAIEVDEYSQTSVPSIWAVGDVTDRMALTPVALMEAMALLKTLFGGEPTSPDHSNVATAVFSNPQIGTVGLSEEQAVQRYKNVDIYTSTFRPMRNTISGAPGRSFMKLVVAADSGTVVGCHMVGPDSGEIMQGMAVAVKMGVTKAQLDCVVGIHPTAAEEFVTMRTASKKVREGVAVTA